ncbi:MAG: aminopeptidase P family protein [Candidatus Heimdallarchaeota archaeon]|nr:aminopeptidase P family protein [Candidatus Heimdallarchaeota archaeon]
MNRSSTPHDVLLEIVREKHQMLPKLMKDVGIDCWLVFMRETAAAPDPVQNLVIGGGVVWDSAFIFHLNVDKVMKTAIMGDFDADAERAKGIWDEVITYTQGITDILHKTMSELDPKNIALNYSEDDVMSDGLNHGQFVKLSKILHNMTDKFTEAAPIIQKLRSRKSKTELKLITESTIMAQEINVKMMKQFKLGMSEIEIQNMFHAEMDSLGVIESWERTGCPAVDAGPEKKFGHIGPTDLKIGKGGTLHNDFGVQLHGYCSDIQRMWYFGKREEIPEELLHAFKTVHGAITAAAEIAKPGLTGHFLDSIARDHVINNGYEEYKHALGHSVGTKAHDGGTLLGPLWERYGDLPNGILEKNNVFTLELYVATKNYGMVSLEEMIVITDDGCEFIIPRQEEFICIEL